MPKTIVPSAKLARPTGIFCEYFRRDNPASPLVEVKRLVSPDLMIEIEAIAVTAT
jgi:enamine deaminase RidA (YjgF/YER057c/UK114 family)